MVVYGIITYGSENMQRLENLYKEANEKLNNDMNKILQAFIKFYGVENSEYIINKIKDSRIIWYDDSDIISDNIYDCIISSISRDELDEILQKRKKEVFLQSAYIDEFDILVLPLSFDLVKIIHEINHKIGSHIISKEPLVQISGISYSIGKNEVVEYDSDLNEAINQKMTLEILEELKNMGLKIDITPSWQEYLFPVIDSFYNTFKNELKEVNITGDLIKFKQLLGEEYYNQFSQLIFMSGFRTRRNVLKEGKVNFSTNKINTINDLVSDMKEHYDNLSQNNYKK